MNKKNKNWHLLQRNDLYFDLFLTVWNHENYILRGRNFWWTFVYKKKRISCFVLLKNVFSKACLEYLLNILFLLTSATADNKSSFVLYFELSLFFANGTNRAHKKYFRTFEPHQLLKLQINYSHSVQNNRGFLKDFFHYLRESWSI